MPLDLETVLDVAPIPVDAPRAARQAVIVRDRLVAAGGVAPTRAAAVQVILDASPNETPSELLRLRMLYRHAYTAPELGRLVDNTFSMLGLAQDEP